MGGFMNFEQSLKSNRTAVLVRFGVLAFLAISILVGCAAQGGKHNMAEYPDGLYAAIDTSKGEIMISLEYQKTPLTVINFTGLAEGKLKTTVRQGKPFYDGLTFHRVIPNFMIQGGDPAGNGTGGPGYQFADEFDPSLKFSGPGVLAMANAGPGTNGSQFFITHVETPWLQNKHTIFGKVVKGQDVVNNIAKDDKINKIEIIRKGKDAEAFANDQAAFDAIQASAGERLAKAAEEQKAAAAVQYKKDQEQAANLLPGAKKTASGIYYIVQKQGNGAKPKKGQTVDVHYTGTLMDGTEFDSSVKRKQPFTTPIGVGRVIAGWDEMVMDMKVGEKRKVVLPPELAYGDQGAGGVIKPNAFLVFEIELLGIK